ncbi:MAG: alpha-L-arabinofuranosidase C-terminal domain-containing protein [Eubacteriales bacterium]|nr:alpha-L-arabinofuranosidase C-terminal domain-containing protein [Eubacteriales bacterium]
MAKLFLNSGRKYGTINRNLYGQFAEHLGSCIYNGIYVGERSDIPNEDGIRLDVVEALRHIRVPVIRWPGGSFSENYHWRDAVGPKQERRPIVNSSWGDVVEDNSFGTHEFFRFCEMVGAAPYIAANVTTGTVRELEEWISYITDAGDSAMARLRRENGREEPWRLPYVGIGNENWSMRPEFYADRFHLFSSGIHSRQQIERIACGPDGANYDWTDALMQQAKPSLMNGLSLHYYTMPGYYKTDEYPQDEKRPARDFDREGYYRTLRRALYMETLIRQHCALMERRDPEGRIGLVVDEWGTWHQPEPGTNPSFLYQQNTMRDAIVAGLTLNIFNRCSERVRMANIAQAVNVLQAMVLTREQEMVLTPTYHVFDLYRAHQDARRIESYIQQDLTGPQDAQVPALSVSASEDEQGVLHATLVNTDADESRAVQCLLEGRAYSSVKIRYLSGAIGAYNDFDRKDAVQIREMTPPVIEDNTFAVEVPACCVMELTLE